MKEYIYQMPQPSTHPISENIGYINKSNYYYSNDIKMKLCSYEIM